MRSPLEERALDALHDTLAYSRERDYVGWDYCDGMSSRILRSLPVESKWLNLAFQETAKRAPVNVRPLLLVEARRNFMGAGLFAMANLNARRLLAE
ncbi:MAG: antibiotic ABC transporter permease, partial [Salinigranum sp.]